MRLKQWLMLMVWLLGGGVLTAQSQDYHAGQLFLKIEDAKVADLPEIRGGEFLETVPTKWKALTELKTEFGIEVLKRAFKTRSHQLDRIYALHFQVGQEEALLRKLEQLPGVEYAERCPRYKSQHTPNDLSLNQWHLNKINAKDAWDLSTGSAAIVLAVVDDAVLVDHEDLAPILWTNPGEIPGDSIDNDGNGFIDDVNGYDVADDDNDPRPPSGASNFNFGHGTHVSGIAVAASNNGKGIASIGYSVSLMPVKTKFDSTIGNIFLDATIYGVDYAIASGADVVNMSYGGSGYSSSHNFLFEEGYKRGMVFVAAAGNDAEYKLMYPGGYPKVIMVGSTRSSDQKSGFSNWHPYVDVMAPGSQIYSTAAGSNSSYTSMSGTSMASPLTAGLCALMLSLDSTKSPADIKLCLQAGCDDISFLNNQYDGFIGAGRINAYKSLDCVLNGVGVEEELAKEDFVGELFPNPSRGNFSLELNLPQASELSIEILDLQGRSVRPLQNFQAPAGNRNLFISNFEKLPSGLYKVRINSRWGFQLKTLQISH